jgi:hypothetical protein
MDLFYDVGDTVKWEKDSIPGIGITRVEITKESGNGTVVKERLYEDYSSGRGYFKVYDMIVELSDGRKVLFGYDGREAVQMDLFYDVGDTVKWEKDSIPRFERPQEAPGFELAALGAAGLVAYFLAKHRKKIKK